MVGFKRDSVGVIPKVMGLWMLLGYWFGFFTSRGVGSAIMFILMRSKCRDPRNSKSPRRTFSNLHTSNLKIALPVRGYFLTYAALSWLRDVYESIFPRKADTLSRLNHFLGGAACRVGGRHTARHGGAQ